MFVEQNLLQVENHLNSSGPVGARSGETGLYFSIQVLVDQ